MTATGWTWDYVKNNMTFKRYLALKNLWRELPPLPITVFAIAKCLGMEMKVAPIEGQLKQNNDVYYDESFYKNTAATPWRNNGASRLSKEFELAGGVIK